MAGSRSTSPCNLDDEIAFRANMRRSSTRSESTTTSMTRSRPVRFVPPRRLSPFSRSRSRGHSRWKRETHNRLDRLGRSNLAPRNPAPLRREPWRGTSSLPAGIETCETRLLAATLPERSPRTLVRFRHTSDVSPITVVGVLVQREPFRPWPARLADLLSLRSEAITYGAQSLCASLASPRR